MKDSKKGLTWLESEIQKIVDRYKNDSARYKKEAFYLKITSVFLAAIITVLLGLKIKTDSVREVLVNVSLVLSAVISVLSAYEAFFDPRSLWVRETVTFARIKDLQRDFLFWKNGLGRNKDDDIDPEDIDQEVLEIFKRRLDFILQDTLKYWMKIRGAPDIERNLEAKAELKRNDDDKKR
ncbi:MAG: DUF4231 domain-containing protein [Candidatus Korobacteraceae bacterium]|jgi:hypothetical protein